MDLASIGYETQENPTGGGTSNHFPSLPYHTYKYDLFLAMGYPLGSYGCFPSGLCGHLLHPLNPAVVSNTGLMSTSEGRGLFRLAVECALSNGQYVEYTMLGRTITYTGMGLMSTTAGWFSKSLTTAQKEDVFRCVIARINAFGEQVSIVLSGQNVRDQRDPNDQTPLQPDAFWDVKITPIFGPYGTYYAIDEYVWPLSMIGGNGVSSCVHSTSDMSMRVCDEDPDCGFEIRTSPTDDCIKSAYPGEDDRFYYTCNTGNPLQGRPVVQSWASGEGLAILNPQCLGGVEPELIDIDPTLPYIPSLP
ncbi:hypothetical protein [Polyangium sp. y55x31]|uniref:hypothetical protein n=1 Tax=Polyangium sp. y55x31 TaxID=3042688 RepID=UPI002483190F|nr:hypothetical protein [Polyangium sp. y55x31]MDI1477166.1 hypothetical protein [Polyangium sp. y55x31]